MRLIEYEGIENVTDMANYTNTEIDTMANRNSKRTPNNTRVQMDLAMTKALKAISHRVRKKLRKGVNCDLNELNQELIGDHIYKINKKAGKKDADSKLYYPRSLLGNQLQELDKES